MPQATLRRRSVDARRRCRWSSAQRAGSGRFSHGESRRRSTRTTGFCPAAGDSAHTPAPEWLKERGCDSSPLTSSSRESPTSRRGIADITWTVCSVGTSSYRPSQKPRDSGSPCPARTIPPLIPLFPLPPLGVPPWHRVAAPDEPGLRPQSSPVPGASSAAPSRARRTRIADRCRPDQPNGRSARAVSRAASWRAVVDEDVGDSDTESEIDGELRNPSRGPPPRRR